MTETTSGWWCAANAPTAHWCSRSTTRCGSSTCWKNTASRSPRSTVGATSHARTPWRPCPAAPTSPAWTPSTAPRSSTTTCTSWPHARAARRTVRRRRNRAGHITGRRGVRRHAPVRARVPLDEDPPRPADGVRARVAAPPSPSPVEPRGTGGVGFRSVPPRRQARGGGGGRGDRPSRRPDDGPRRMADARHRDSRTATSTTSTTATRRSAARRSTWPRSSGTTCSSR